jgi:hypothetical protein
MNRFHERLPNLRRSYPVAHRQAHGYHHWHLAKEHPAHRKAPQKNHPPLGSLAKPASILADRRIPLADGVACSDRRDSDGCTMEKPR